MKRFTLLLVFQNLVWCMFAQISSTEKMNADTLSSKVKMVSSYCSSNLGGSNFDIKAVSIHGTTLNNSSSRPATLASDGSYYTSFAAVNNNTCYLTPGSSYSINVTTYYNDNISVWIDYNQNGVFETLEWTQVTLNSTSGVAASATIAIPTTATIGQTGMRIRSNYYSYTNAASSACSYFSGGCTEDYIITIGVPIPTKPIANFNASSTIASIGNSIQFTDLTTGVPTSWEWTFDGATPSTSTNQNPNVCYAANGTYPVKLVAINSLGKDSITKTGYITVADVMLMPVTGSNSVTTCGIIIYDNGGKANYASSSNGVTTIYPGTSGSAVKLQFSEFNTSSYNDYLYIYNGTTTSANQIASLYGSVLPSTIIATNPSGALTLKFTSNSGSSAYSGFVAQASCVPLVLQNIYSVSWTNSIDNNLNTYAQSKSLSFNIKNDDTKSAIIYAKIYSKLSSASTYTLMSTSSLIINASSTSANQTVVVSGFNEQNRYDFKIELYNSSNILLNTSDFSNNSILGNQRFESALDDVLPSYCIYGINGGSFDISAVSISGTTLNNTATRPAVRNVDGSYYTLFEPTANNTCVLTVGSRYFVNVTTKNSDNISLWIDYNHDLTFQDTEWIQVATTSTSNVPSSISFIVPNTALSGQTRMRIRTNYNYYTNLASNACSSFYNGCTEDYTITLAPPVLAQPVADFMASTTKTSLGSTIQFSDLSTGAPSSWRWTFEGGTPATSTSQFPSVLYSTDGIYTVKLVVSNSMGSDSISKIAFITILNTVNVPMSGSNSISACGVTIYDNGGTSNYANSSNGTLTINPSIAGNAIRLLFSELAFESCCDYLYIYNGTSTTSPLIGTYGSTTIPAPIVATNSTGSLTLKFTSDGSSNYSGFVAQASCVPLLSQYISSATWINIVDNNYNGYAQKRTLNFKIKNDDSNNATLYAKIYSKLSSETSFNLLTTTSSFTVNGNSSTDAPAYIVSELNTQGSYDIKIEIYNTTDKLLNSYDNKSSNTLGDLKFESGTDDGIPIYCVNNLGGGSFDITSVSITATTLNNSDIRPTVRTLDGSFFNEFAATGNNTCTLYTGKSYIINVCAKNNDKISVWIDYNQDLLFQTNEWVQVATSTIANRTSSGLLTVPASALNGQTRMRVRTTSSGNTNGSTDACTSFTGGCTEDYFITISTPVLAKPTADFIASTKEIPLSNSILFYDISTGIPESYKWSFQGGTPSSSTSMNPAVLYSAIGTYEVKLVVTNSIGTDSITKTAYITVSNSINIPSANINSISACGITIYDNGGKSNYLASSDGVLTINPATAGSAVKLQFTEFNTSYNDYLYIYNGTSTSSTQIANYYGSSLPTAIKATNASGALTLRFVSSSNSSTYTGFVAQATCIPLALQNVNNVSWSNYIDNNYNNYYQSRTLNFYATNSATSAVTIYAKIYYKLTSSSNYDLLYQSGNFTISANSNSETIIYKVSNIPLKGYYDFKIELYNSQNSLISAYDFNDNSYLKNQGFEPANDDGLASYCTSYLGGSSNDITLVSITGTTLYNNSIRPTTGSYNSFTSSINYTGILKLGNSYPVHVVTTNNDIVSLWIDFDHNGSLDASEWTQISTSTNGIMASTQVYIPVNALIGPTRLRIRSRNSGTANYSTDACTSFSSGCTEDYIISIEKPTDILNNTITEFKLYPNPARDEVNISIPGFGSGTLQITDMLGRSIVVKNIEGEQFTENVSGLSRGMYIFTVKSENGELIRKQVLIQ